MTTTAHIAHACTTTMIGVPMITSLISSAISSLIAFALGWYIKGRGMTGVKIDLNNVKTDVETLKAKISAQVPAIGG